MHLFFFSHSSSILCFLRAVAASRNISSAPGPVDICKNKKGRIDLWNSCTYEYLLPPWILNFPFREEHGMCGHRSSRAKDGTLSTSQNPNCKPQTYLRLNEVRRHDLTPVPIKKSQRRTEGGGRDAPKDSLSDDTPPTRLRFMNSYYGSVNYAG